MAFTYNKFTTHGLGSAGATGAGVGRGVPGSDFLTRARKGRGRKLQQTPGVGPAKLGSDAVNPWDGQGMGSAFAAKSYNRNTSGPGRHHGGLRNTVGQGGKGGHGGPINAGPQAAGSRTSKRSSTGSRRSPVRTPSPAGPQAAGSRRSKTRRARRGGMSGRAIATRRVY